MRLSSVEGPPPPERKSCTKGKPGSLKGMLPSTKGTPPPLSKGEMLLLLLTRNFRTFLWFPQKVKNNIHIVQYLLYKVVLFVSI